MPEKEEFKFGLVGKDISYSFSKSYFTEKFRDLELRNHKYVNFDIRSINDFPKILEINANLIGLNVTIPYKERIIPFLDELDDNALQIGAVNTIKILANGKLKGYNTDTFGFENSLNKKLKKHHRKALILGTGGASKAVNYTLNKLKIETVFVSRRPKEEHEISYEEVSEDLLRTHNLIVNCTPLGTFPNIKERPEIKYQGLSNQHLLYDLIYNPAKTSFLEEGEKQGAKIQNGFRMLELQAEESWRIWNS